MMEHNLTKNQYEVINSCHYQLIENQISMPKFYDSFKQNGELKTDNYIYGFMTPFDRYSISKF